MSEIERESVSERGKWGSSRETSRNQRPKTETKAKKMCYNFVDNSSAYQTHTQAGSHTHTQAGRQSLIHTHTGRLSHTHIQLPAQAIDKARRIQLMQKCATAHLMLYYEFIGKLVAK